MTCMQVGENLIVVIICAVSKKIGMPLVQVACLHSDFILLVDWTVWSWEADPTHEGLALHIHIEIKCMENCFICVEA